MPPLKRYTDLRSWLRHLVRSSVHAGTGALLAGGGSNALESAAPTMLKGIGLDLRQMVAVFASAAFLEALRKIHAATAETRPPMDAS